MEVKGREGREEAQEYAQVGVYLIRLCCIVK